MVGRTFGNYQPYYDEDLISLPSLTVYEAEEDYEETGLLDQNGNKLIRFIKPNPIGFLHDRIRSHQEQQGNG